MKINKIELKNFKAISEKEIDFNGCSAIITAGNNKGKTSLLRGLIDRMRGLKPDVILKEGESKGYNVIELSDGSRIEWKFTDKTESFAFITKEGFKQSTGVLKAIGERYFGNPFDIDKFLLSSSKEQSKMLANLIGVDFTGIDNQLKEKYAERTEANREVKRLEAREVPAPVEFEKPDIDSLKAELEGIKKKNFALKKEWEEEVQRVRDEVDSFNREQYRIELAFDRADDELSRLTQLSKGVYSKCIDMDKANKVINSLERPKPAREFNLPDEPEYIDTSEVELRIESAYSDLSAFNSYERDMQEWEDWKKELREAEDAARSINEQYLELEEKKRKMIAGANIPKDFEFTDDGLLYKGLPLSSNQTSSSGIYIAALKLGSLALGEVKTMHFDASFLDKFNLMDVEKWASDNGLQLLIERPDFDGGDIKYEIIES